MVIEGFEDELLSCNHGLTGKVRSCTVTLYILLEVCDDPNNLYKCANQSSKIFR